MIGRPALSRLAEQDLNDLLQRIAQDNPPAGLRFVEKIEDKCSFLAENPHIGQQRFDLGVEVRTFPVGNYLIIYLPAEDGVEVIRIVSGYRESGRMDEPRRPPQRFDHQELARRLRREAPRRK